jgi:hypothetical protein
VDEFKAIVAAIDKIEAFLNKHGGVIGGGEGDLMGRLSKESTSSKNAWEGLRQLFIGPRGGPIDRLLRRQSFEGEDGDISIPAKARPVSYNVGDMKELVDTESDSNKLLREIRDILDPRQGGGGINVGGSTGYPAGQARRALLEGVRGGGQEGPSGVVGPGTRADRNNNPGNIKYGEFAKAQGATGADREGFAIFPDRETGYKAAENLLKEWANGDPGWAANISKSTGIPLDAVPTPEQRERIVRGGALTTAEGSRFVTEAQLSSGAGRNRPISAAMRQVLEGAAEATGLRAVVTSGGINREDYARDPSGRLRSSGRHVGGNAADFYLLDQQGNKVRIGSPEHLRFLEEAAKRGARSGGAASGYMGNYMTDLGITGRGRLYTGSREMQAAFLRGRESDDAQREALTGALKKMTPAGPTGTLNAEVDFKNVPPGVQTSADGTGFKTLKVTATKQTHRVGEGLLYPGDTAYTPWVP